MRRSPYKHCLYWRGCCGCVAHWPPYTLSLLSTADSPPRQITHLADPIRSAACGTNVSLALVMPLLCAVQAVNCQYRVQPKGGVHHVQPDDAPQQRRGHLGAGVSGHCHCTCALCVRTRMVATRWCLCASVSLCVRLLLYRYWVSATRTHSPQQHDQRPCPGHSS